MTLKKVMVLVRKIAFSNPKVSTQTVGPKKTKINALNSPINPPYIAPLVVKFFHEIVRNKIGKFVLAATAKANPTIKQHFVLEK